MLGFRCRPRHDFAFLDEVIPAYDQEDGNATDDDHLFHLGMGGQDIEKREGDVGLEEFDNRGPYAHKNPYPDTPMDGCLGDGNVDRSERNRPEKAT